MPKKPPSQDEDDLTEPFHMRLSARALAELKARAKKSGMKMSTCARLMILKSLGLTE